MTKKSVALLLVVVLVGLMAAGGVRAFDAEDFEKEFADEQAAESKPIAAPETQQQKQQSASALPPKTKAEDTWDFDEDEFEIDTLAKSKHTPKKPTVTVPATQAAKVEDEESDVDQAEKQDEKEGEEEKKVETVEVDKRPWTERFETFARNHNWTVEIGFVSLWFIYFANYFAGKSANKKRAKSIIASIMPIFTDQFAAVSKTVQASPSIYNFAGSGRINCHGFDVELNLIARQDLASYFVSFFFTSNDTIKINIPLGSNTESFSLALTPQKKKFTDEHEEEGSFLRVIKSPSKHTLLCDNPVASQIFISSPIFSVLEKHPKLLQLLYITDFHPYFVHKNILSLEISVPANVDDLQEIVLAFTQLIDVIGRLKFTPKEKEHTLVARQDLVLRRKKAELQRLEEAQQQRKLEKEKKQKEKLNRLSPEERTRLIEKENQKKLKKQQSGRQKVVFS
mmetsp:Transcript_53801/g.89507  ORF Transcript_53801/g.89507 Transcript_53801/m.89507 type:complete len:453 (+) Transcript_53801:1-1359(+)